jgi:hypothetical protein
LWGRQLKLDYLFQTKQLIPLAFHTIWHHFFLLCMVGGSNPVASPGWIGR